GYSLSNFDGLGKKLCGRHNAADEPRSLGFGGVHHSPGQAQIHRLCLADKAGETLRSACARYRAEGNFRLSEPGIVGSDDDVAHHRDLATAAEREPGNCRNNRFAALSDAFPATGDEVVEIDL